MTVLFPAERIGGIRYSFEGDMLFCKFEAGCQREGTVPGTFLDSIVGDELRGDDNAGCKIGTNSRRRKQNNWLSWMCRLHVRRYIHR